MFEGSNIAHSTGHYLAQLRVIFRPVAKYTAVLLPLTYAYIQPLRPVQASNATDKAINMTRFERSFLRGTQREGRIIRLTDIWRQVEVVPVFGKECPKDWNSSNAVELAEEFYVNIFSGKDVYQQLA